MQRARGATPHLYEDVLYDIDVGPILHSYMSVEALLALRCTHRAASDAIAFSGKDAKAERRMLTQKYARRCPSSVRAVMSTMAGQGRLHMLQYMCIGPSPFSIGPSAISAAAARGRMEVLEWAQRAVPPIERGWRLAGTLGCECRAAIRAGKLDVLEWLVAHGYNMAPMWVDDAVEFGHTHVLEWALKRGILVSERVLQGPRLMTHHTSWTAAIMGHLGTLKWLRALEPPCPWEPKKIVASLAKVLRCRPDNHYTPPYRAGVKPSRLIEVLEWMRDNECKFMRQKIDSVLLDVASDLVEGGLY